jgi:pilus assembly protein Flp/PilA
VSRGRGHAAFELAAFGTLACADRATERIKERDVMNLIARLRALLRGTSGQDLLEYALLVALIALVCVAVITSTGTNVQTIFQRISTALQTATPAAP